MSSHTKQRLAAWALWIAAWQAASLVMGSSLLLAGPLETCEALVRLVGTGRVLAPLAFSFVRVAAGFLAAFLLGAALGFAAHRFDAIRIMLEPAVLACKSVPVACVTVLLLIWFGSREVSGIAVFLMAFPALYLATVEGLAHQDVAMSELFEVFEVRGLRRFLALTWQGVLPFLVATSRNACGMAWKAGVAAELIGTPLGSLGERIYQAKILLETADLFAWTILVVAVSFACERAFVWLLESTGPWALRVAVRGGAKLGEETRPSEGVRASSATLGYANAPILGHVDLDMAAGGRYVMTDASGAGKTTLLKSVAGLRAPLGGTLDHPEHVSVVFQDTRLTDALSAEDNVLLVGAGEHSREDVRRLLLELLPADALDRPVGELSGGQRRRVEIVRALAHPSGAVLLDEPFASLDEETHAAAARFVMGHLEGRTLLAASHMPEDVRLLDAEQVLVRGQAAT